MPYDHIVVKRLGAILFFALVCGAAFATDNLGIWWDRNIQLEVGLTSHTWQQNVSGTNEECTFIARWGALPEYSGSPWTSTQIISLRIQCDNMDVTFSPNPGPIPPILSKRIRIASTHFSDGSDISFTITGRFQLSDGVNSVSVEKEWVAKVRAYNKGLVVANVLNEDEENLSESDPRYPTSLKRSAKEIAEYAIDSSIGPTGANARHTMNPSSAPSAQAMTETLINGGIPPATVFIATTHADPLGFTDSMSVKYTMLDDEDDGYLRVSTEVASKVLMKTAITPQYNLVLMWACDTLRVFGGSDTRHPSAWNLLNRTGVAYAGFNETVAAWLKAGDNAPAMPAKCNDPLSLHGKKVLERLAAGDRLFRAIQVANDAFPPRQIMPTGLCPYLPMTYKGDGSARLVNVYLSPEEWDANPNWCNSWYFVLP